MIPDGAVVRITENHTSPISGKVFIAEGTRATVVDQQSAPGCKPGIVYHLDMHLFGLKKADREYWTDGHDIEVVSVPSGETRQKPDSNEGMTEKCAAGIPTYLVVGAIRELLDNEWDASYVLDNFHRHVCEIAHHHFDPYLIPDEQLEWLIGEVMRVDS